MSSEMTKSLAIAGGVIGIIFLTVISTLMVQRIEAAPVATAPAVITAPVPAATVAAPVNTATVSVVPVVAAPQIVNVQPHYVAEIMPFRSCHDEWETVYSQPYDNNPAAGAVFGGAAGALAGNLLSHGHCRIPGTIAGAVIGAIGGSAVQSSMDQPQAQSVLTTVCHTHYLKKMVQHGYAVTYLYSDGHERTKIMPYAPTA